MSMNRRPYHPPELKKYQLNITVSRRVVSPEGSPPSGPLRPGFYHSDSSLTRAAGGVHPGRPLDDGTHLGRWVMMSSFIAKKLDIKALTVEN